ncbi:hypothetical protein M9458_051193, partial [Cirrhinus mrigala]
ATSTLIGRAFHATNHAGAALHTTAVLQAYQTDIHKDLSTRRQRGLKKLLSVSPVGHPVPTRSIKRQCASLTPPRKDWGKACSTQQPKRKPDLKMVYDRMEVLRL